MKLAVIGREPLDTLQEWVLSLFAEVNKKRIRHVGIYVYFLFGFFKICIYVFVCLFMHKCNEATFVIYSSFCMEFWFRLILS